MKCNHLRLSLLFALLFCSLFSIAQRPANTVDLDGRHWCATDQMHAQALASSPELRKKHAKMEEMIHQKMIEAKANSQQRVTGATFRVPIVVHVFHDGTTGALTDQEVLMGIDFLNQGFLNGPAYDSTLGVNTEIEFCLAERDPSGNPSTGIVRIDDPFASSFTQSDDAQMKTMSRWDPTKYVNLYSVPQIGGGIAGYAYLPSSHGSNVDGIVCYAAVFGNSASTSSTIVHEFGHYLGLYHTWQGGCPNNDCLLDGDRVCDTPPDDSQIGDCSGTANSCTTDADDTSTNNPFRPVAMGGMGDQNDVYWHYLDYGNHSCRVGFTEDSKLRMISFLTTTRNSLIAPSNLAASGCQCDLITPCTPLALFQVDQQYICPGQTVQFTDLSTGPAASWNWSFPGGTPSSSTQANPSVSYTTPGQYEVTLTIANSAGNSTETILSYINVVEADSNPVQEGFEATWPVAWTTRNPDGGGTWVVTDTTAHTGTQCMVMDNWAFPAWTIDDLTTHLIDLRNHLSGDLTFDFAYRNHSFPQYNDTLQVWLSSDCGENWTQVWEDFGISLATVSGNNFFSRFVPTQQSEWENVSIDLSNYIGQDGFKIRFRNRSGSGQSLYIDNVNIVGTVETPDAVSPASWSLSVHPNPFSQELDLNFSLPHKSKIRFELLDLQGRQLYLSEEQTFGPGAHHGNISAETLSELATGMYLLRGITENSLITRKVIKQ